MGPPRQPRSPYTREKQSVPACLLQRARLLITPPAAGLRGGASCMDARGASRQRVVHPKKRSAPHMATPRSRGAVSGFSTGPNFDLENGGKTSVLAYYS